jgi:molecular chaperone DnaK (HSP70)
MWMTQRKLEEHDRAMRENFKEGFEAQLSRAYSRNDELRKELEEYKAAVEKEKKDRITNAKNELREMLHKRIMNADDLSASDVATLVDAWMKAWGQCNGYKENGCVYTSYAYPTYEAYSYPVNTVNYT